MADSSDHRDTKIYSIIFNYKYRGNNILARHALSK